MYRVQRVRPARGGLVQRGQRVVVAPLGHAFGVRVQWVQRVQKVQKVQRVMVAPCGRIINWRRRRPPCLHGVVLYNSPLNQPGRRSRFRAEPEALRGLPRQHLEPGRRKAPEPSCLREYSLLPSDSLTSFHGQLSLVFPPTDIYRFPLTCYSYRDSSLCSE